VKPLRELLKKRLGGGGDDDVVHIKKYVGELLTMAIYEERDIRLGGDEAKPVGVVSETLVPGPWSLLEAVEGLVQTTYVVRTPGVNKARRLLTVDLLVKVAMKKGILDVELVNRPRPRESDAEDDADRGWLDDGAEGLVEINPRLLREAADDPSSLVASKAAVGVKLVLVDPFP
jgi:hypothetical protein